MKQAIFSQESQFRRPYNVRDCCALRIDVVAGALRGAGVALPVASLLVSLEWRIEDEHPSVPDGRNTQ